MWIGSHYLTLRRKKNKPENCEVWSVIFTYKISTCKLIIAISYS